jgi:putative DNA primase/helicase
VSAANSTARAVRMAQYRAHGWPLVKLRPDTKKPFCLGWNTQEVCDVTTQDDTFAEQVAAGKASVGLGVAHARLAAVDVDDMEKARPWFAEHGVDLDALMSAPDAVRRESGRPNRTLLLYRVDAPLRTRKVPTAGIEFLCATSEGLTTQIAIPPSVNPTSKQEYVWVGDWRRPPKLPEALLQVWESVGATDVDPERKATPPDEKSGIVGAICRAYDPREEFPHSVLPPELYKEMCETVAPGAGDRYAYLKAASGRRDGLKVLEDGAIQIFDATFPGGVGSMNIFDFMRLALYEPDSKEDLARPMQDRPSYRQLVKALQDEPRVRAVDAPVFEDLDVKEGAQLGAAEPPKSEAPKAEAKTPGKRKWKPVVVHAVDVKVEELDFLWHGVFARKYQSVVAGDPGLNKSTLLCEVAARRSRGDPLPGSSERTAPGHSLFVLAEDRKEDVVVPRLIQAGANLSYIHFLEGKMDENGNEGEIDLLGSLPEVDQAIQDTKADFAVWDPVSAFYGGIDSYNDAEMRALLKPVQKVTERRKCAFVYNTHLTKDPSKPGLDRVMGSRGLTAHCRAVFIVAKDKNDPSRRLFIPAKANLAKDTSGFSFRVEDSNGHPKIVWDLDPCTMTLAEALMPDNQPMKKDRAALIIAAALEKHGELDREALFALTQTQGISSKTTYVALNELGLKSRPSSAGGKWVYSFSMPETATDTEFDAPEGAAAQKSTARPKLVPASTAVAAIAAPPQPTPEELRDFDTVSSVESEPAPEPAPQAAAQSAAASNGHAPPWAEESSMSESTSQSESINGNGRDTTVQTLMKQLCTTQERAEKLVNSGLTTPELVAQAPLKRLTDISGHQAYAKTLQLAAGRWLKAQRAAGGAR